ncbi:paraquat-inducible protein A [Geomesophilobacter sediminis]|uniref:Paraquat-inducible protein A n=1 Tax=Geomesophilobacter sediminis TaxID=2798584 RepID=A0A8J7M372_9BACT|nr:paraquat-inducible protein A [Geomesophilobacter sediminis]MBJ6727843.1 paraquat-inducible protein A [Geomesophilobacter sediminis]
MEQIVSCQTCGLVQRMDAVLPEGTRAICPRCQFVIHRRKPDSRTRTFCLALAALILYFPANLFPIVQTDYWGMEEDTTIFQGIMGLFEQGNYFVGSLVFTTSILSPALKILGLLFLSLTLPWPRWKRLRAWVYKIIKIIDPWNMLEVTLLAMLVSIAELGEVATVHPGAGVFSFAAVVVLTICATITFDTRLLWDTEEKP